VTTGAPGDIPAVRARAADAPVPQRIAIVLPTDGAFDSRARRLAATLGARGHDVQMITRTGHPGPVRPAVEPRGGSIREARRIAAVVGAVLAQRRLARRAIGNVDVVHAMGLLALPVAEGARRRGRPKVVYDARDLYVSARNIARMPGWVRAIVRRVERRWARSADGVASVNQALASHQAAAWSMAPGSIVVVHNCPPRYDAPPTRADHLRAAAGLPSGTPLALYHGGFGRGRGLEQLAASIREPGLEAVHAAFLGYGPLEPELRALAADQAAGGRIHVLPAVAPAVLLD